MLKRSSKPSRSCAATATLERHAKQAQQACSLVHDVLAAALAGRAAATAATAHAEKVKDVCGAAAAAAAAHPLLHSLLAKLRQEGRCMRGCHWQQLSASRGSQCQGSRRG